MRDDTKGPVLSGDIRIAAVTDVAEGDAIVVAPELTGLAEAIALVHAEDGDFYAIDDTCTHEDASLAEGWVEGTEVECPLHAASFCLKTGAALCLPATQPVRTHTIEVRGGEVYLVVGAEGG